MEEKEVVLHSTEEADGEKSEEEQNNEDKDGKRNTLFEEFEDTVRDEKKEWTTCDEKLSHKLQHLKIRISDLVETNEKLNNELSFHQERISRLEEEIMSVNLVVKVMKLTKAKSDEEIVDLKNQVALLSSIAYNGDKTKEVKSRYSTAMRVS